MGKLSARLTRKLCRDSEKAVEEERLNKGKTKTLEPLPKPRPTKASDKRLLSAPNLALLLTQLLEIPLAGSPSNLGQPEGGPSLGSPMADPQANPSQVFSQRFTKHSYPKYKGRGDDEDADSYIKLFESVSITNRETSDDDRLRIFPSLLHKRARSWYNHKSIDPNGLQT